MEQNYQNISKIVAISLMLTVVSQVAYMAALSDVGIVEGWTVRSAIWTIELLLFAIIAVTGLVGLTKAPQLQMAWSAIAVSGLANVLQAGIGLSMFLPATEAGEDFAPLMETVLAGAFVFYFLAKVFIGFAAIAFGMLLFRDQAVSHKIVGVLSGVSGLAALGLNVAALPQGLGLVLPAGASGTIATLFLAIALWLKSGESQQLPD